MEWVEVQAKTVEAAVEAALSELGIESRSQAEVEVLQAPERGFLGMGGRDAIVRVKRGTTKRRRRRGRRGGEGSRNAEKRSSGQNQDRKSGRPRQQRQGSQQRRTREKRPMKENEAEQTAAKAETSKPAKAETSKPAKAETSKPAKAETPPPPADPAEQAKVVSDFVEGLVAAYGLEGDVKTKVDEDDVIYVDVVGEQTEALVGAKGAILQAVLDLLKIVVQRKTHDRARIRLDIAGYAERRREALKIYTQRLADQVKRDGGEVMLEPMHPADRKVVHDAVGELDGIRSWSEGEEPRRSVIIGLAPGFEATEGDSAEEVSDGDEDDDFENHETPDSVGESADSELELEVDQAEEGADA